MSLPIVAIVGRPNVGKSTLVNRLAGGMRDAIVHEVSGVTRDRSYHHAEWCGCEFMLIDTGGIDMTTVDAFGPSIREQAFVAAADADAVIFVVDGRTGPVEGDADVARILKRSEAPIFLVVNKLDDPAAEEVIHEFWRLGLGEPMPVSAIHGHGTGDLLDAVIETLPGVIPSEEEVDAMDVAIVGRPNSGKSSLFNRLVGFERTIVSEVPGTTRDAIDTIVEREGSTYRLVDTAGLRRRAQIDEPVEYYSFVRAMRALDRADVALLLIDSEVGITAQDQRVATFAAERGCAVVVLLNKWDLMKGSDSREHVESQITMRLSFLSYAPLLRISAKSGKGVHKLWDVVDQVYGSYTREISTPALNRMLTGLRQTGHTMTKGRRTLKLKYVTQTRTKPPGFTYFVNHADLVDATYERYLENRLRESFDLDGTPLFLRFKQG
jgi:ribosome-associated GTPase EngA